METTGQAEKTPRVELNDPVRKSAIRIIEAMFDAYTKRGGVAEMEQKLRAATEGSKGLAAGIYDLSQTAYRLGQGSPRMVKAYFQAICRDGESAFKEKHQIENLKDVLPCWIVYKSEIIRAVDTGIKLTDFDTYGAMKVARVEKSKADRETAASTADGRGARAEGNSNRTEANAGLATKVAVAPALAATIRVMTSVIERMDAKVQERFATDLSKVVTKYANMLEAHKAKEVTKAAPETEEIPKGAEAAA